MTQNRTRHEVAYRERSLEEINKFIETDPDFPIYYLMRANYLVNNSTVTSLKKYEIKHLTNRSCSSLVRQVGDFVKKAQKFLEEHLPDEVLGDFKLNDTTTHAKSVLQVQTHLEKMTRDELEVFGEEVLIQKEIITSFKKMSVQFMIDLENSISFAESMKIQPSNSWQYWYRAIHIDTKYPIENEQAFRDLNKSIELNPQNYFALHSLAVMVLKCEQDHTKALEIFNKALAFVGQHGKCILGKWKCYHKLHNKVEAIKFLNLGIAILDTVFADCSDLQTELAGCYVIRAMVYSVGELKLGDLNKSITVDPRNCYALEKRGLWFIGEGQFSLAKRDFDAVLAINKDSCDALFGRGCIYFVDNENDLAIAEFSRIFALGDGDPDIITKTYRIRGRCFLYLDRFEEAICDFSEAVKRGDNDCYALRAYSVKLLKEKIMKM